MENLVFFCVQWFGPLNCIRLRRWRVAVLNAMSLRRIWIAKSFSLDEVMLQDRRAMCDEKPSADRHRP